MKVLLLSPRPERLEGTLLRAGDQVTHFNAPVDPTSLAEFGPLDWVLSYGYRHIIRPTVLAVLPGRFINLHLSYLPFNAGADPNFWSLFENTPSGVTIHLMDEGVDTGPILLQEKVTMDERNDTMATSYERLQQRLEQLFDRSWVQLRVGSVLGRPQVPGTGTRHLHKQLEQHRQILRSGWDTPIREVVEAGVKHRLKGRS